MSSPARFARETKAVYRDLLRAARVTFEGDPSNQMKFRSMIRTTFVHPTLDSPITTYSTGPKVVTRCSDAPSSSSSSTTTTTSTSATTSTLSSAPEHRGITEEEYQARLKHWSDVAMILRKNVVQGRMATSAAQESKVGEASRATEGLGESLKDTTRSAEEEEGVYRLRITPHTELGDNNTIKTPPKLPTTPFPNRERRRRRKAQESSAEASESS